VDEMQGVQVKLWYPLTVRAIPERLRDASCGGAIQFQCLYPFYRQTSVQPWWIYMACVQWGVEVIVLPDDLNSRGVLV